MTDTPPLDLALVLAKLKDTEAMLRWYQPKWRLNAEAIALIEPHVAPPRDEWMVELQKLVHGVEMAINRYCRRDELDTHREFDSAPHDQLIAYVQAERDRLRGAT